MCITFTLLWLSGNASVSRGPPRFAWLDRIIKVTVCTFPYFYSFFKTEQATNQPSKTKKYIMTMIMAMCTNKNETLFWPACVRVCEHQHTFTLHALFYYDIAVIFSVCIIYLYIYIYTLHVCVHKLLLLIYILSVFWSPEYEHVPLCSRPIIFTELMRWLFFGLVGRQPFFITLSACLFFTVFSISVTLFFIFLSWSRNAQGTNIIDFPSRT